MRPLGARNRRRGRSSRLREGRFHLDVQVLAVQTQTGPPLMSSAPVSLEQRSRSHVQGMKQDAHLAWFGCGASTPLALLAQRTRTATANTRSIDHAQAPIGFSTVFVRQECAPSRATQAPIRLEGKVGSGETASIPGGRGGRRSIPRGGRRGLSSIGFSTLLLC